MCIYIYTCIYGIIYGVFGMLHGDIGPLRRCVARVLGV